MTTQASTNADRLTKEQFLPIFTELLGLQVPEPDFDLPFKTLVVDGAEKVMAEAITRGDGQWEILRCADVFFGPLSIRVTDRNERLMIGTRVHNIADWAKVIPERVRAGAEAAARKSAQTTGAERT